MTDGIKYLLEESRIPKVWVQPDGPISRRRPRRSCTPARFSPLGPLIWHPSFRCR